MQSESSVTKYYLPCSDTVLCFIEMKRWPDELFLNETIWVIFQWFQGSSFHLFLLQCWLRVLQSWNCLQHLLKLCSLENPQCSQRSSQNKVQYACFALKSKEVHIASHSSFAAVQTFWK